MPQENNIMKYETVLPEDFDGVFRFTNWTDEEFVGVWGGKQYHYPANKTSPMIIPEHSPLEIQNIRKKFAKDLAEREFFKSKGYDVLRGQEGTPGNRVMNSIHQAGTYSMDTLTPFIQKALIPLEVGKVVVTRPSTIRLEEKLTKNPEGELNSGAVKSDRDLEVLAKGKMDERVLGAA